MLLQKDIAAKSYHSQHSSPHEKWTWKLKEPLDLIDLFQLELTSAWK